jgi:hypothetical protein
MQFVIYRNYGIGATHLLENSTWASRPDELRDFLSAQRVRGGQGNEAIEIGLQHCNREIEKMAASSSDGSTPHIQVIMIGDAPANTPAEVQSKRAGWFGGEAQWQGTDYAQSTTADVELRKLIDRHVPVHSYFVRQNRSKPYFENVAAQTGGSSGYLDVESSQGSAMLTDMLSKSVLEAVDPTGELVDMYNKKYAASFSGR